MRLVGTVTLPQAGFAAYKHTSFGTSSSKTTLSHVAFAGGLEHARLSQGEKNSFFPNESLQGKKASTGCFTQGTASLGN